MKLGTSHSFGVGVDVGVGVTVVVAVAVGVAVGDGVGVGVGVPEATYSNAPRSGVASLGLPSKSVGTMLRRSSPTFRADELATRW